MGTRADFYVGRGPQAEWLGSIAWDGYPTGRPKALLRITDEATYRKTLAELLASLDDATLPRQGWPWPWDDSRTTDYAYAFDAGKLWAYGRGWFDPLTEDDAQKGAPPGVFPDMSDRKNVTLGPRSGLIVVTNCLVSAVGEEKDSKGEEPPGSAPFGAAAEKQDGQTNP